MPKRVIGAAIALIALMGFAAPAAAQYAPTTTSPGQGPKLCNPNTPDPGNPPPCSPRANANANPNRGAPGTDFTVSAPAGTFAPGVPVTLYLTRTQPNGQTYELGTATTNANGSVSIPAEVPDVAKGSYVVWIEGLGPDGQNITAMDGFVVNAAPAANQQVAAASAVNRPVPAAVAVVQNAVSPDEERAILAGVNAGGTAVITDSGEVEVLGATASRSSSNRSNLGGTGSDTAIAIAVSAALLIAGVGLVALARRRRGALA